MSALAQSRAVLSGASSGIGAALVARLRAQAAEVHALARDSARLQALARELGCIPHAVDVTDTAALEAALSGVSPDIVVCNAGSNFAGSLLHAEPAEVDGLVRLNLGAVLHLLRLTLPGMIRRGRGHVVLVGSIAGGHALTGGNAVYHATKAGIRALADQLRLDLVGSRVRVTEIAPGRTRTAIFTQVTGDEAEARRRFFDDYEVLEPGDVADAIMYALTAPAHVNIGHIELTPTLQAMGGLTTVRRSDAAPAQAETERGR